MSHETIGLEGRLYDYYRTVAYRESDVLRALREETAALEDAEMQISPEQGQLMTLLAEATGARRALEVGTFTGYSALCVAAALPADGRLITLDMNEDWTAIARKYWDRAGLADKIDLRLAPALDSLNGLIRDGGAEDFDFAFIDADKKQYDDYYEAALTLLRAGGLVLIDNVLWGGEVANPENQRNNTKALRALNEKIQADDRVTMVMVPVGDGLTIARKR